MNEEVSNGKKQMKIKFFVETKFKKIEEDMKNKITGSG